LVIKERVPKYRIYVRKNVSEYKNRYIKSSIAVTEILNSFIMLFIEAAYNGIIGRRLEIMDDALDTRTGRGILLRASGFGLRASGFGLRASGFGLRASG
jgi:hypothetical protein